MNTAPQLAKSLHTVTVLVRTASYLMRHMPAGEFSHRDRLNEARTLLGLDEKFDYYGLIAAALKQLEAGK